MNYSLVLSILLAIPALAVLSSKDNRQVYTHGRALEHNFQELSTEVTSQQRIRTSPSKKTHTYHHEHSELQDPSWFTDQPTRIAQRSAMQQVGYDLIPLSRSASTGTKSQSSRSSSPLRLPPSSSGYSSDTDLSRLDSRSSTSSGLSRDSRGISWDGPPQDYNEAFRRLGVAPPQSPRSRQGAEAQTRRITSQNGHSSGQLAQQRTPTVGEQNVVSRQHPQRFSSPHRSASSGKKAG